MSLRRINSGAWIRPRSKCSSPIILDGENPWEHYHDGGERFLSTCITRSRTGALDKATALRVTMDTDIRGARSQAADAASGPSAFRFLDQSGLQDLDRTSGGQSRVGSPAAHALATSGDQPALRQNGPAPRGTNCMPPKEATGSGGTETISIPTTKKNSIACSARISATSGPRRLDAAGPAQPTALRGAPRQHP